VVIGAGPCVYALVQVVYGLEGWMDGLDRTHTHMQLGNPTRRLFTPSPTISRSFGSGLELESIGSGRPRKVDSCWAKKGTRCHR